MPTVIENASFLEWRLGAAKGKSGIASRIFNLTCGGKVVYMTIVLRIVYRTFVFTITIKW